MSSIEWYESVCFDEPFLPLLSLAFIGSFSNRHSRLLLDLYLSWVFLIDSFSSSFGRHGRGKEKISASERLTRGGIVSPSVASPSPHPSMRGWKKEPALRHLLYPPLLLLPLPPHQVLLLMRTAETPRTL